MKKNDKISYRQKSPEELTKVLQETLTNLSETKIKYHNGSTTDSSIFKKLRYQISFIKSLLNQK